MLTRDSLAIDPEEYARPPSAERQRAPMISHPGGPVDDMMGIGRELLFRYPGNEGGG
ncbi:MAG: hypothetical protein ACREON_00270 [Gemmatimonadaceae bacterium]